MQLLTLSVCGISVVMFGSLCIWCAYYSDLDFFFSTWTDLKNFLQDSGPFCAPKYIHSRVFPLSPVYEGKGFLHWSSDDDNFFWKEQSSREADRNSVGVLLECFHSNIHSVRMFLLECFHLNNYILIKQFKKIK